MSRAEEHGSSYFRLYGALQQRPTAESFRAVCLAQGLPAPSNRMFAHIRRLHVARRTHYIPINQLDVQLRRETTAWVHERVQRLVDDRRRETEDLDFKQEVGGESSTTKAWAAMANSGGGVVVYGVSEKATTAIGVVPIGLQGIEERFRQLNRLVDPPVAMDVDVVPSPTIAGRGAVVVRVAPATRGLIHLVSSRAPRRDGVTTRYMTSEEIRRWVCEGPPP